MGVARESCSLSAFFYRPTTCASDVLQPVVTTAGSPAMLVGSTEVEHASNYPPSVALASQCKPLYCVTWTHNARNTPLESLVRLVLTQTHGSTTGQSCKAVWFVGGDWGNCGWSWRLVPESRKELLASEPRGRSDHGRGTRHTDRRARPTKLHSAVCRAQSTSYVRTRLSDDIPVV